VPEGIATQRGLTTLCLWRGEVRHPFWTARSAEPLRAPRRQTLHAPYKRSLLLGPVCNLIESIRPLLSAGVDLPDFRPTPPFFAFCATESAACELFCDLRLERNPLSQEGANPRLAGSRRPKTISLLYAAATPAPLGTAAEDWEFSQYDTRMPRSILTINCEITSTRLLCDSCRW
jgi:hypothetical protein